MAPRWVKTGRLNVAKVTKPDPDEVGLVPFTMTETMMRAYWKALRMPPREIEEVIKHLGPEKWPHEAGFITGFRAACRAGAEELARKTARVRISKDEIRHE